MYTSLTRWSKDDVKATLSGFFLAASALTALVHLGAGLTSLDVGRLFLAALPGILGGVLLGNHLSKRTSEGSYRRLLLGLLGVMGVMMLVSALMGQDRIRRIYDHAVQGGYRFFSYGDASLLIPDRR